MAKKMLIDNYYLTELIGKGSFGEVYYTKKTNEPNNIYATKKMKTEKVEAQDYLKYFTNEINILKEIDHNNIVRIKDLKKTSHHYYIIMEYCNGGTLKENFRKYRHKYGKPFSEKIIQHIMRQIVEAVNYLHSKNIVHRDLKADNMLLNYYTKEAKDNLDILHSDLKIIDFGTATYKSKINRNETEKMLKTVVGSPLTMDPVILKMYIGESEGVIPYNEKIDIWSLGILCYYLFTGNLPFIEANLHDLLQSIEKGDIILPTNISVETISFLIKMMEYFPDKRASAQELLNHRFINKYCNDFFNFDLKYFSEFIKNGNLCLNIKDNDKINLMIDKYIKNKNAEKSNNIKNIRSFEENNNYNKILNKFQWGVGSAPLMNINCDNYLNPPENKNNKEEKELFNQVKDKKIEEIENKTDIKGHQIINEFKNNNINNNNIIDNSEYQNDLMNSSPNMILNNNFEMSSPPDFRQMSMAYLPPSEEYNLINFTNKNQEEVSKSSSMININQNISQFTREDNKENDIKEFIPKDENNNSNNTDLFFSLANEQETGHFNFIQPKSNNILNSYQPNNVVGAKYNLAKKSIDKQNYNPNNNMFSSMPII